MGSSKAPEYAKATVNSGLWGSSTADKKGATYTPTSWMNSTMGTVTSNLNPTLNNMNNQLSSMNTTLNSIMNGNYLNDENFKTYKNQFDKQAQDTYDSAVLGTLADRGLMRSSGMQALTNNFTNSMQDNLTNLMDNYYNRMVNNYNLQNQQYANYGNNLSNLLNTSNALYNYMLGVTGAAQNQANNVSNYNLGAYQAENAANNALFGTLANAGASLGGAALGNGGIWNKLQKGVNNG